MIRDALDASPTPLGGTARMPVRMRGTTNEAIGTTASGGLRRASPLAKLIQTRQTPTPTAIGVNDEDSSDDEGNAAPVLSAAAEEILGGRSSERPTSGVRASQVRDYARYAGGSPVAMSFRERDGELNVPKQRTRSPEAATVIPKRSPRVVKVSASPSPASSVLKRARSVQVAGTSTAGSPTDRPSESRGNYKTPAPRVKSYIGSASGEEGSPIAGSSRQGSGGARSEHYSSDKSGRNVNSASADARDGNFYATRDHGVHSSIRIKRIGQTGTFLRGPARRGMIRRQSEEEQSPLGRNRHGEGHYGAAEQENRSQESPAIDLPASKVHFAKHAEPQLAQDQQETRPAASRRDHSSPPRSQPPSQPGSSMHRRVASAPHQAQRGQPTSHSDKENNLPLVTSSQKPSPIEVFADALPKAAHSAAKSLDPGSEQRPALASKTTNTPLRPAPPPPKMNAVDTATAAAGAMASKQRKKQAVASMTVNGRRFSRLDCIGRGGSGKVFRVMAENYKLYALKRVSLEGMDELAIRGFKGEINLLQKLKDVDRVVRLVDYEVNDERQTLTVLMEMGELDLKKLLDPRLDEHTGEFDITFTRYIWREMLECVKAVHEHDVVHSDLKPANFVMIQSRLKLIDFGIANAIADDTVNVHREQQIGTPNYMAPEALVDTNAHERGLIGASVGKLMKLGKPSDVWSLGCILYQIVYGKPPFGHITATHSKAMAIVSDKTPIAFPEVGLGGNPVPLGLLKTLKGCLTRDQRLRPTIDELLGERDPFLHPDAPGLIPLNEDLLGMIQRKLVSVIKQRGSVPDDGELAMWQANMFENVRNAIREGKVQV